MLDVPSMEGLDIAAVPSRHAGWRFGAFGSK